MKLTGNIVDLIREEIFPGIVTIKNSKIVEVSRTSDQSDNYIIPGFIDSHVHIESSMLTPAEFGRIAVTHGTVAVITDPHEIANVLGIEGVKFMIRSGERSPLKFYFSAPSCVPATPFETSGAILGAAEIEELLKMEEIKYLGEFMNFPGVINRDSEVMRKIESARKLNKKIDGHAPFLTGEALKKYVEVGISTDHECTTIQEAEEKIGLGMKILIREGSACRDFDRLIPIAHDHTDECMFCCDDLHPDELVTRHIDKLVRKALAAGLDIIDVLKIATLNPIKHYGLNVGLLQPGDDADLLVVDDLKNLNIHSTYIKGEKVAESGNPLIPHKDSETPNRFQCEYLSDKDLQIPASGKKVRIIEAGDGNIITGSGSAEPLVFDGNAISDPDRDLLKIAVINRYNSAPPSLGFIRGFGLQKGAIASSVAHDSHNIIVVGTSDKFMMEAANEIIKQKGGICAVDEKEILILPLPVAGLISDLSYDEVAEKYEAMEAKAKVLGSKLKATFMTLSFMALLVIPELKISDQGLFDGKTFQFTDLWLDS